MRTDTSSRRRRGRGGQGALVLPAQVGCSQVFSGGMARTALPSATSGTAPRLRLQQDSAQRVTDDTAPAPR